MALLTDGYKPWRNDSRITANALNLLFCLVVKSSIWAQLMALCAIEDFRETVGRNIFTLFSKKWFSASIYLGFNKIIFIQKVLQVFIVNNELVLRVLLSPVPFVCTCNNYCIVHKIYNWTAPKGSYELRLPDFTHYLLFMLRTFTLTKDLFHS